MDPPGFSVIYRTKLFNSITISEESGLISVIKGNEFKRTKYLIIKQAGSNKNN